MLERIVATFSPAKYEMTFFCYSASEGWQTCNREDAADAPYFDLHSDAPWPGCPAGAGAVACLKLTK